MEHRDSDRQFFSPGCLSSLALPGRRWSCHRDWLPAIFTPRRPAVWPHVAWPEVYPENSPIAMESDLQLSSLKVVEWVNAAEQTAPEGPMSSPVIIATSALKVTELGRAYVIDNEVQLKPKIFIALKASFEYYQFSVLSKAVSRHPCHKTYFDL